jgi:hypothetical protein
MSKSPAQVHEDILVRTSLLKEILDLLAPQFARLKKSAQDDFTSTEMNPTLLIEKINEFTTDMMLQTIEHLDRPTIRIVMESNNFTSEIERLTDQVKKFASLMANIFSASKSAAPILYETNKKISSITTSIELEKEKIDMCYCVCGDVMSYDAAEREYKCPTCGSYLDNLEESNAVMSIVQKISPETDRHFNTWMKSFQGYPTTSISESVIARVKKEAKKHIKINYRTMRDILKTCSLELYNPDIPFFMKEVTKISPPQFTHEEVDIIRVKYHRLMMLYEQIKDPTINKNRPYYPFFICKAIQSSFSHDEEKMRVYKYVHTQLPATTAKNDEIFRKICESALPCDGLTYVPTKLTID